ncbi:replication protein [Pseudomonas syringae pv. pisi str. 1704B]|uniref:Replication protein n=1 Tax=Pseudomonas syringae pv. pisi str. 1704B TaxID=629263 RepID=F3GLE4_PSESJ|nr:replication protein [Pseudomonas syringae pv. pisi str. 1704B]
MQLDGSLSLTERQSLAAKRTHELRHKATESKIRAACRQLQDQGKALVRSAIAALAGVSASTVARYAHILSEVTKPATVSVLKVSADAMPTVTPGDQAAPREAVQCLKKQALTDRAQGVVICCTSDTCGPAGAASRRVLNNRT